MSRHRVPGATIVCGNNSVDYIPDQTMAHVVEQAMRFFAGPLDWEAAWKELVARFPDIERAGLNDLSCVIHDSITVEFPGEPE